MVFFVKDAWVWLEHSDEAWLPVQLKEQDGDSIVCRSQLGETFTVSASQEMPSVQPSSLTPCDNMVKLEELSEGAILHNLRMRYTEDEIYTYISSILISVNPFKMLPIYSPTMMRDYMDKLSQRNEMPPHVYALADDTFRSLIVSQQPQSVIISGESGAGKTEATKLVLQYLTEMSGQGSRVEQQLLQANPIVEAFGNAKTVRNNNSSRFGKWIEILLNREYHIAGARIFNYLLEKSRIVAQGPGERNYHAFYQLCAGASAEERKTYMIGAANEYRYLSGGDCFVVDGTNDASDFKTVRSAMAVMQFEQSDVHFILSVLASVLHLGNVRFASAGADKCSIESLAPLQCACQLLGVSGDVMQQALVTKTIKVMTETIVTPINAQVASDGVDALAKALYGSLFNHLIHRLNQVLNVQLKQAYVVGVLDIFGFEIFETNRFEQFCINYANEKLQQHFNEHIFRLEQRAYAEEKIDVAHVDFVDNQPCLDLIEAKGGVLHMTDEEIRVPRGSDSTLLEKMDKTHGNNPYYVKRKLGNPVFTVTHYAGEVVYTVDGFLEKNKDTLDETLQTIIASSSNAAVASLLSMGHGDDGPGGGGSGHERQTSRTGGGGGGGGKKVPTRTLGNQFKAQLVSLMETLHKTQPHFIRCIKPNAAKVADYFDSQMVTRQLRYLGIQEVVKIRQLGYPVRFTHQAFWSRYKVLKAKNVRDEGQAKAKEQSVALLQSFPAVAETEWRVGITKVFVRNQVHAVLEKQREERITHLMIKVQALARMRMWRSRYKRYKTVKDALVTAIATCKSHTELEAAIEAYENLGMATDDTLVRTAKQKAKVLYEHSQATHALQMALESHDEALLATALDGARKVRLPAETPVFVEAERYYNAYVQWKAAMVTAMQARELGALEKLLTQAQQLGVPRDDAKIRDGGDLLDQLRKEAQALADLERAVAGRQLASVRTALETARKVRLSAEAMAPAVALEKQLVAEQNALRELKHATESKNPDIGEVRDAIAHATQVGLARDLPAVANAVRVLEHLEAEQRKAEAAKQAKKEREAELEAMVRNTASALEEAVASNELRVVENALRRAQATADKAGKKADVYKRLVDQCHARMQQLVNRASTKERLRAAIESRHVAGLEAALAAARAEKVDERDEDVTRAMTMVANIKRLLDDLARHTQSKDIEALSKCLNAARQEVAADGPEAAAVEKFSRHRDVLVAEKEAEKALQFAVRARNESMLNVALTKAKADGVALDDKLVQEARAVEEEVEQENIIREQELVVATRRVTVAEQRRTRKQTQTRRVSVLTTLNQTPEAKCNDVVANLRSGYSYADMQQYELYMFHNFRSPAAYAKGKLFGAKALKAGMLFHTADNLPTSLTKLVPDCETAEERKYEKHLIQEAIQMFKSVQGFMGDRALSYPEALAQQVLDQAFKQYLLRDELFAQLLKQLRRNKNKDSVLLGWQLLALCCDLFPPSDDFVPFVLRFIQSTSADGAADDDVKNYANYCVEAIVRSIENPPRANPMTIDYIVAFKQRVMTAQSILVFFLDMSAVTVNIEPTTTVQQVLNQVCQKINLKTQDGGFALYFEKGGRRAFLPYESFVCECEAAKVNANAYLNESHVDKADGVRLVKSPPTRFVFVKRMYMGGKMAMDLAHDPVGIALMYHQAVDEVSHGNYFLPIKEAANLFAISSTVTAKSVVPAVSSQCRDQAWKVHQASTLKPPGVLYTSGKTSKAEFERLVNEARDKLADDVRTTDYLRAVSKYPLYGAQFFTVQNSSNQTLPQHLIIGINMGGIYLMDWNTRDLLCFFPVQGIAGWKGNDATLIVRAQMELTKWFDASLGGQQQRKGLQTFYFKTLEGKGVANLVRSYVDALFALVQAKQAAAAAGGK